MLSIIIIRSGLSLNGKNKKKKRKKHLKNHLLSINFIQILKQVSYENIRFKQTRPQSLVIDQSLVQSNVLQSFLLTFAKSHGIIWVLPSSKSAKLFRDSWRQCIDKIFDQSYSIYCSVFNINQFNNYHHQQQQLQESQNQQLFQQSTQQIIQQSLQKALFTSPTTTTTTTTATTNSSIIGIADLNGNHNIGGGVSQNTQNIITPTCSIKIDPYLNDNYNYNIYPQTLPLLLPNNNNINNNNNHNVDNETKIYYATSTCNILNNNNNNNNNYYNTLTIPARISSVPPQQSQINCCILPTTKLTIEPKWCVNAAAVNTLNNLNTLTAVQQTVNSGYGASHSSNDFVSS